MISDVSGETASVKEIASAPASDLSPGVLEDIEVKDEDDAILRANGHVQAMPRQFSWISALGLGFSITNSWVGYLSCFGQNLIYGGPRVCIFSLVIAFVFQLTVTTGLSELASAFPSSGGQYHYCYILSPKYTRRYSAYIVGWLSILSWWIATCSGISLAAVVMTGIANFCVPEFVATQWQIYLTYVAVSLVSIIPNFAVPNKMSVVTQCTLYLSLAGFLVFFIVTLVMHENVQPESFILERHDSASGWNEGTAWMLAISNAMYSFGGTDGAIHISEELPRPGRRVPQVMILTMIIGLFTTLSLFIPFMFFIEDMDAVRRAPLPSLELMYQITGSKNVTLGLVVVLWAIYVSALPAQWITSGRLAWAFARDNGTPFPAFFSRISPKYNFPVHTTIVAFIFSCIYGLLYLASTTAFNSIITSAVLFMNITYAIPQGILLTRGRKSLPARYMDLGWVGYVCNIFSVGWIVVLGVLVCMPPGLPVTLGSMNYVCVIVVGLFGVINALWFMTGRRRFEGPSVDWGMLRRRERG
ncbi:choline transporter [Aspergillus karnatakaensis]|uniref:choline transporter n=1 Tax=Aspergillus karnatakaensis TaxID=1810916 RepID=UPI003CCDB317